MSYYLFAALASAQACAPVVDTAQGYPKAGTDIGGGIHVPPSQSVTQTYALVLAHPTLANTWIYQADGITTPALQASALAASLPVPQPVVFQASQSVSL